MAAQPDERTETLRRHIAAALNADQAYSGPGSQFEMIMSAGLQDTTKEPATPSPECSTQGWFSQAPPRRRRRLTSDQKGK